MIDGLSLEYAYARVCASLGDRPDDRLWQQLHSSRTVPALLELMRGSPAAECVSGIPVGASGDVIELAFRQKLRSRIDEVAAWSPPEWRAALQYTRHLADLPALMHLLTDEPPPAWVAADLELGPYALDALSERRAALTSGPFARLAEAALEEPALAPVLARLARGGAAATLHRVLAAWSNQWRARWPTVSDDIAAGLQRVAQLLESHLRRFGAVAVADAHAARQALSASMAALVRRHPAQPAALFAYLAVFALDLERLRGEFVRRVYPVGAVS
ncbi:MAG TPA: hypothetical protein PLE54_16685 [Burkholderiaceae bacterium]|nr:hypothetical protein [Burkholderiaceae bacterium]HQR72244.1 hypothetical protein [Burkholderiaceae bacterium]